MTTITALPPAPSRGDSVNFASDADTFVGALPTFVTEVNALATELNAASAAAVAAEAAAVPAAATAVSSSATAVSAKDTAVAAKDLAVAAKDDAENSASQLAVKLAEIVSVKDYGAVGDGTTSDTAAIAAALASGAMRIHFPYTGFDYVLDGPVSIPRGVTIFGDSIDKPGILCKTATAGDIVFISVTGYTGIEDLQIRGDSGTSGTLVEMTGGTYTFTGNIQCKNVRFSTAKAGLKINSIFNVYAERCQFLACTKGVDASPLTNGGDNGYINTVHFNSCYWGMNTDYDVYANPAVRISNLTFTAPTFDPGATVAKVYLFTANPVLFLDAYFEGGPTVPAVLSDLSTIVMIGGYLNGTKGIKANAATAGNLTMQRVRNAGTTDIIDYPSSNHVVRLTDLSLPASGNVFSSANQTAKYWDNATVNGTTYDLRRNASVAHVPVLSGTGTAGTPTYTAQVFRHNVIGNMCFFSYRVSITAIGGMVGNIQMSLPFTSANSANANWTASLQQSGITGSGGRTVYSGRISPNTAQMTLFQGGVVGGDIAIVEGNLAAATTIIGSGMYEIA